MSEKHVDLSTFAERIAGKEAILCIDSKPVARVRTRVEVQRPSADAERQDLYLRIESEVVPTHGLRIVAESGLPVFGASRDILEVTDNYVTAPYTNMEFYFDRDFIETIVAMVSELPPGTALADDYTTEEPPKSVGKFKVVNSLGPTARRVRDFVEEYRWTASMGDQIRLVNR